MEPQTKKKKTRFFSGLVVGFLMGAAAVALAPQWWDAHIPESLQPRGVVEGAVSEKSAEKDRILLKLTTDEGVLLATFTERLEEIELLVETGDRVTLGVPRYEPFLENPSIERVRKQRAAPEEVPPELEESTPGTTTSPPEPETEPEPSPPETAPPPMP